ncbi:uncharacterized protein [Physcomitrium patens]|uniref:uncharacterized protein isoform X3 n=1 Tax=Physcomitrium patens TaxID=3218 RepID=UPI003CCE0A55
MACHRITKRHCITSNTGQSQALEWVLGLSEAPTSKLHLVLCLTLLVLVAICFISLEFRFLGAGPRVSRSGIANSVVQRRDVGERRYLYWGPGIDCPGKYCVQCGGLGHQESSLRCALEEALFLNRTFVLPSTMCIAKEHNNAKLPQLREDQCRLELNRCSMAALYDLVLMSQTVPVIASNSKEWHDIFLRKDTVFVQVEGIKREELKHKEMFRQAHVVNRTANKQAWFMECKNRHNQSAIMLSYSFLQTMVAPPLRAAAELIKEELKDYDALHVRRGDKVKVHKAKSGALRTMYAHLDNDTQPEAILKRIKPWIPAGRTLYIATDERQVHYFDKLFSKVMKAKNFSSILDTVVHNNYQLFIVERLVLMGAKTLVNTWKENADDLSLSDETKKKLHRWEHAVNSS